MPSGGGKLSLAPFRRTYTRLHVLIQYTLQHFTARAAFRNRI